LQARRAGLLVGSGKLGNFAAAINEQVSNELSRLGGMEVQGVLEAQAVDGASKGCRGDIRRSAEHVHGGKLRGLQQVVDV
jgi:hypothetical protein